MKKTLLLLFSYAFLTSVLSMAQTIVDNDGLLYLIEQDHAVIARQDKALSGDIIIPETIEHEGNIFPVTKIVNPTDNTYWSDNTVTCEGGAFQDTHITSISLPSSIETIPLGTFYNCAELIKVSLPESVNYIGAASFALCRTLTEIEIPDNITEISRYAFGNCSHLESIKLPEQLIIICDGAFKNSGLKRINIPSSVTHIGEDAFGYLILDEVTVHYRDLTKINCSKIAFAGSETETLLVPEGTFSLYKSEEPWCNFSAIKEFDDGDGEIVESDKIIITKDNVNYTLYKSSHIAEIGRQENTLEGEVVIPTEIEYDGEIYVVETIIEPINMTAYSNGSVQGVGGAFQNCSITSIELPYTIKVIPVSAFQNCRALKSVKLPSELEIIEAGAFAGCYSLETIELPQSVRALGSASFGYGFQSYTFGGCTNLKHIVIPEKITTLGSGCFKNSGIVEIELPASIKKLEEFSLEAPYLQSLTIHNQDVTALRYSESTFGNVSECALYVPLGAKCLYQEFYPWIDFKSIDEIDDGQGPFVPELTVVHIDSVRYLVYPDGTAKIGRQNKDLTGDIDIRSKLTIDQNIIPVTGFVEPTELIAWSSNFVTTEGGAFQDCLITSVVIPDVITFIPPGTFSNCKNLSVVELPYFLETIGAAAFSGCTSLEELFLPESISNLGSYTNYGFKSYVFGGCTSLKKINIPSGITAIPEACFKNSGLTTFLISSQIDRLEPDCFTLPDLEYVKIEHPHLTDLTYTESIFPQSISNVVLLVPEGSKDLYSKFYPWKNFHAIEEYVDANDEFHYNAYGITTEIFVENEIFDDEINATDVLKAPSKATDNLDLDIPKSYLPSGKEMPKIEAPEYENMDFVRWENMPEYMPSSDIKLHAVYRPRLTSTPDVISRPADAIKEIYDIDGKSLGSDIDILRAGIFIVRYTNGKICKVVKNK